MLRTFIDKNRYIFNELRKNHKKHLKELLIENKGKSLTIIDENSWIKKFNKATFSNPKVIEAAEAFVTSEIKVLKDIEVKSSDIVCICVEKNDIIKLKKFITHYRKIGIDKFVILDNNSNDGTIEYLKKQKDVVLYQTQVPYTSFRRVGWINRIIAHYGYNRWYLIADSDEFLEYSDCEYKTIKDIIYYYNKRKITRGRAIMVDMYADSKYYVDGKLQSFYNNCIFFDSDTYYQKHNKFFDGIYGGPRERIFKIKPCLTKYPLIYFQKKDIFRSHFLYPYKQNLNTDCNLILKHYKFLPNEFEKYKIIAKNGNYYNGSIEYKKYIEFINKNYELDFICNSSTKYVNSNSFDKINLYKKIDWKEEQ